MKFDNPATGIFGSRSFSSRYFRLATDERQQNMQSRADRLPPGVNGRGTRPPRSAKPATVRAACIVKSVLFR